MEKSKVILVTGSTDGIGLETARQLLKLGHRVLIHGRNSERLEVARKALGVPKLEGLAADFSDFSQVAGMEAQMKNFGDRIDVLVNNAGVYLGERRLNADGIELTLAINHFAHMLLTLKLKKFLSQSSAPRVVTVSSGVHTGASLEVNDFALANGFTPYGAYAASKLANLLFTARLAREKGFETVLSFGLHPGVIGTKLLRQNFGMSGDSLESGARTSVFCATAEGLQPHQGGYFVSCKPQRPSSQALNTEFQEQLWQSSIKVLESYR